VSVKGSGGEKVTVVAVFATTLNMKDILLVDPFTAWTKSGFACSMRINRPTTTLDASGTVTVVLPLVAPAVMGRAAFGRGYSAAPASIAPLPWPT
jgi:hypothetical protein